MGQPYAGFSLFELSQRLSLGNAFVVRDIRFTSQTTMDSWCNALLDENSISSRSVPLVMSAQLANSNETAECFYCGLPNHTASECPTRTFFPTHAETWQNIASMDLDAINKAFRQIELALSEGGVNGFSKILEKGGGASSLMQAILILMARRNCAMFRVTGFTA